MAVPSPLVLLQRLVLQLPPLQELPKPVGKGEQAAGWLGLKLILKSEEK